MGDKHRIARDFSDPAFVKLLGDADRGKLKHNLSPFLTRPAYAYTSAAVGGIGDGVSNVRRTNPSTKL